MIPKERYSKLKEYLSLENPVLLDVIDKYEELDNLSHKIGLLQKNETYTSQISWWPMISILGTFSAGKSSFINNYIGQNIQESGNQAVDDKFTVICYGKNDEVSTLPGMALDADPRFPFYNISEEVNKVAAGEGNKVNSYMQLKTLKSEYIKGKILIDSPGFDADSQRDGILKITSHIVDISDLVIIFFDARHPEPGAMRDTLEHLVGNSMKHNDANKVLYVLNQIDTTAKEDNLEAVVGSWQRALSQKGLISGNFYSIYNEAVAVNIEDEQVKQRLQRKSDQDKQRILERMDKVSIERAYRIIKSLDEISTQIKEEKLPKLQEALQLISKKVFWSDSIILILTALALGYFEFKFSLLSTTLSSLTYVLIFLGVFAVSFGLIHRRIRNFFSKRASKLWLGIDKEISNAIDFNTTWYKPSFLSNSKSWHKKTISQLEVLVSQSKISIQKLNDQFVSPTGNTQTAVKEEETIIKEEQIS